MYLFKKKDIFFSSLYSLSKNCSSNNNSYIETNFSNKTNMELRKKIDTLCRFKPKPDFKIFISVRTKQSLYKIFLEPRRRLARGVRENQ